MSYIEDIKKHAISCWPEEMVGYLKGGVFHPLKNVSKTPKERYSLSTKDKLFVLNLGVDYLVHSHPVLDNNPSDADLVAQRSTKIPFMIIGTDGQNCTNIREVL